MNTFLKRKFPLAALAVAATLAATGAAQAALLFNQNVSPGIIMGSHNATTGAADIANGAFTVDNSGGLELGLRAKIRHDATGQPTNTFNSNGDGTYSFAAGVAPTQAAPTAVWSFEWSVNVDPSGTSGKKLDGYIFELLLDTDPSQGVSSVAFDPIGGVNPGIGVKCWDHSTGTNATTAVTDQKANCGAPNAANRVADYAALLASNSVAQNSWKPHWYIPGFDPTVNGTYNISLAARDASTGFFVGASEIQVIVGTGGAAVVPVPGTLALVGLALAGVAGLRRKQG